MFTIKDFINDPKIICCELFNELKAAFSDSLIRRGLITELLCRTVGLTSLDILTLPVYLWSKQNENENIIDFPVRLFGFDAMFNLPYII